MSRYYRPEMGRWMSPEPNIFEGGIDTGAGLMAYNVFAYCANNPMLYADYNGEFVISTMFICVIVGAVIGATVGGIIGNTIANNKGYTGWNKVKCIAGGALIGGVAGGVAGYCAAPVVVSLTGVAGVSITSGGIATIASVGTSFGNLGSLIINNGQQIVNWGRITIHAHERMIERGITRQMVELWVRTGKALQQTGDKILYITKQGAVVIDKVGRVITAYTSSEFDNNMKTVIEKLFGK